jgi:hypothetical protein
MFEDSFLDSFMESHIGGWTHDTERMYDNEAEENWWSDREEDDADEYDDEYDGQPDEYTEWQDVYGGDDWDHGQYDEY